MDKLLQVKTTSADIDLNSFVDEQLLAYRNESDSVPQTLPRSD
jgi:hypothetical protein